MTLLLHHSCINMVVCDCKIHVEVSLTAVTQCHVFIGRSELIWVVIWLVSYYLYNDTIKRDTIRYNVMQ